MKILGGRKGLTMVELMLIVVIIGIVAAMAVPRFSHTISRLKFRTSARNMVSRLRLARSNAITQKQQYGVHFDNTQMTLTMFLDLQNPSLFQFENGDSVILVDTLPDGFIYLNTDYGKPEIVYRANGSASNSGNVYFLSYNQGDDINIGSIEILASTGRTKLGPLYYY